MTTDTQHPAVWRGADLSTSTVWIHELTADEVAELVELAERLQRAGMPVDELEREPLALPRLGPVVDGWADELDGGRGFVLVRGLPVEHLGEDGAALAYVAHGLRLGVPVSQNAAGDPSPTAPAWAASPSRRPADRRSGRGDHPHLAGQPRGAAAHHDGDADQFEALPM